MSERIAFKMFLKIGAQQEYRKRHDSIWPELKMILKDKGISEYYIFLDEDTDTLFAFFTVDDLAKYNTLSNNKIMKKWWVYMTDLMETNEDDSPKVIELEKIFYLK